ncbi:MAG: paraquat-inducible protein A [Opitutales bacterium]|nr:paraquat-inducible protein A [Opitutales bacterium]
MKQHGSVPTKTACQHCDLLVDIPALGKRQIAYCPRCGSALLHGRPWKACTALPLVITAFLLLGGSLYFPFLSLEAPGSAVETSIYGTIIRVSAFDEPILSIVSFSLVIVYPFSLLVAILTILLSTRPGSPVHPSAKWMLRWVSTGSHWAMADVFIIGVMVSLTKITSIADVQYGAGFYFYACFAIVFTLILKKTDYGCLWHGTAMQPS